MSRIYNHPDGTFAVEFGVLINGRDDELTGSTEQYSSGYWVAVTNNVVLDKLQFDEAIEDLIETGYKLIGVWYDKDKDVTYVDGVEHVTDLIKAIQLGREYNQDAIYDIAHKSEIYV
jgi:hypothetical protein